ncbi:MAG TPA: sigma-70 family RNA polymerase sigma factor [Thermoanaerobaculia bacterium]|nr:sigma-70 family RNA polymerase sigma factor [Thermoanaerobaculia bacterium]
MTDFHALYERYSQQVRRLALFLSNDPALADDVTSETFVRAWTTSGPIREETVRAYLLTIARHLVLDSMRRARRFDVLDDQMPDSHVNAERRAETREALRVVLAEIRDLPFIDRAALLMRAQEEMSYEEIARTLGISLSSVKVKIHRARRRLMRSRDAGKDRADKSEER